MNDTQRNIDAVKSIYKSFGEGAIGSIVERLHEDVEWEMGATSHGVPWLEPGRGRAHALGFFKATGEMQFDTFEVVSVMGDGDLVVGLVNVAFTVAATRRSVRERFEAHVWRFDDAGLVTGFRHCVDTHQHVLAAQKD